MGPPAAAQTHHTPATDNKIPDTHVPDKHVIVLFGAAGDLAARKLLPGFLRLDAAGLMPKDFRIIGTSRRPMSDEDFRDHTADAVDRFGKVKSDGPAWADYQSRLSYVASSAEDMDALAAAVGAARDEMGGDARVLAYLSIPPLAMGGIVEALGTSGIAGPQTRVILEKPFGTDADSARALNHLLHGVFSEDQIFRIDHFLGKEDVQNILAVRFANRLFEPVWCAEHVAEVQIDVPETLDVANRAKFYEETGAYRDMIVTHLLQALGFVAMEAPDGFTADSLAAAKQAVFDAIAPIQPADVVRGQYAGYRDLPDVADDSDVETLVAVKVEIDNERWAGVPIHLRTGKCMPDMRRVVTVNLKEPPMTMFPQDGAGHADQLVFEIGEPGGIRVNFLSKEPGPAMVLGPAHLDFAYKADFDPRCELEAYERLLHDAMLGDRTLFNTAEGIERLWEVSAPVLEDPEPVQPYDVGTWGPPAATALADPVGWYLPDS